MQGQQAESVCWAADRSDQKQIRKVLFGSAFPKRGAEATAAVRTLPARSGFCIASGLHHRMAAAGCAPLQALSDAGAVATRAAALFRVDLSKQQPATAARQGASAAGLPEACPMAFYILTDQQVTLLAHDS